MPSAPLVFDARLHVQSLSQSKPQQIQHVQFMKITNLLLALALSLFATFSGASERGYFGFATTIDAEGFFNPTVNSIKVASVVPNSPAAKAGIAAGDYIVEVEGQPVAGAKGDTIKPYMQRELGQSTRFVIKKVTGENVQVVLVAGPKVEAK